MHNNKLQRLFALNKGRGSQLRAEDNGSEATLYLYDVIVDSEAEAEWYGGIAPESFSRALKAITAPTIHLRINSPGGSVFGARAIEQAIREHPASVVAHIDGYAASAASVLMLAADQIVIAPGGMVMIHKAWAIALGNSDDMLAMAELLEKIDGTLVGSYARRTRQPADQIEEWMRAETWFTAEEAVASGFADAVAEEADKASARWDLSVYDHAPAVAAAPAAPAAVLAHSGDHQRMKLYFDRIAA